MLTLSAFAQSTPLVPDTIYVNGNIYTGVLADAPRASRAIARVQAMAVSGDRILSVGTDAEIKGLKGVGTKVVDLGGRFVMPGFNDAHLHLAGGGLAKSHVDLIGARSLEEMKRRIAQAAKDREPGEWLIGRGWDHTLWPGQKLPTRQDIDAVTGDRPALFSRVDGHISIANSKALQLAHIGKGTPDPPGGKIDRDASGEPTGIVRETARDDLQRIVPPPSLGQRKRALQMVLDDAARAGLTSLQDNSDWADFLAMEELQKEGKLTARISEWLDFRSPLDLLRAHRDHHPAADPMLHTGMLKGYMDGSLGSRTAALLAPYSDDPGNSGIPRLDQETLNRLTEERVLAGFQIGFHAIGDRAAQMALDAFAQAELRYNFHNRNAPEPRRGDHLRLRIEHDQVIQLAQISQFTELGVIASVQPCHLLTDMRWVESRLGAERAATSYPWRSFLAQQVRLAFGTDFPVEPMNPFRDLYAAVTRQSEDGRQTYHAEQALTVDEAIEAYTSGSAYAEFAERDKGKLAPGMLADFIVLDRDITRVSPQQLLKTHVLQTYVGGRPVFASR